MSKKWRNLGDVNHREHGAKFVQVDYETETVEVVTVDAIKDANGKYLYCLQEAGYSFDELKEEFHKVASNVANFADWEKFRGMNFIDILEYLAIDMIGYQGGSSEEETGRNYWDLLSWHGVQRHHVI